MAKSKKKLKAPQKTSAPKSSSKWIFWAIGAVSVAVLAFIIFGNVAGNNEDQEISYDNQPYIGEETAPVEVIEFGDYKCPHCKEFNNTFFPLIEQDFIETGKVKFYFMNYAFINVDSTRSAQFAETVYKELGNDTFWKFHKLLFEKQPDTPGAENEDIFTDSFLEETLKEVASAKDTAKVVKAYKDEAFKENFRTDMSYAKQLGVTGTPALFVDGKPFEGSTAEDFEKMVNEAAKEKK
ncbi:thioredoxin domain-containing protein [Priestia megaterium]|nr:thioredoxin domain-containing protein [Priestia megaterium]